MITKEYHVFQAGMSVLKKPDQYMKANEIIMFAVNEECIRVQIVRNPLA